MIIKTSTRATYYQKAKKLIIPTSALLIACVFLSTLAACGRDSAQRTDKRPGYASFRDVPGASPEDIAAIESILEQRDFFIYGMPLSSESFIGADGEIGGFAAGVCEWLSSLFGIPFIPQIYGSAELREGLTGGAVDFTGYITLTGESDNAFFNTSTVACRPIMFIRVAGSLPLSDTLATRPPRYAMVEGDTTADTIARYASYEYEPVLAATHAEAYDLLISGEVDAIPVSSVSEVEYIERRDIVTEYFSPWEFTPVMIATGNPDLRPFIDVASLALAAGDDRYIGALYNRSYREYQRIALRSRLNDEELEYIKRNPIVKMGAQHYNYPIDFYNRHENEWQGIIFDILSEVSDITGLTFEVTTDTFIEWTDLLRALESGEVSLIPELTELPEREGRFLWQEASITRGQYVLISLIDYPQVSGGGVYGQRVGLIEDYASTAVFYEMFPGHANAAVYRNLSDTVAALEAGMIDVIMCSKIQLLTLTNYEERAGFKINYIFDRAYSIKPGYNIEEAVLLSIIDKALRLVEVSKISEYWHYKTFDYQSVLTRRQRVWINAAAVSLLFVLAVISYFYFMSRQKSKVIARQSVILGEINDSLEQAHELANILLDSSPICIHLWDTDLKVTDCNAAAVKLFGFGDKQEFISKYSSECMPEYQPDGRRSDEVAIACLREAFEDGFRVFEYTLRIPGEGVIMPAEVTLVRIFHMNRYLVAEYTRDLREQKAAIEGIRMAEIAEERSQAKSAFLASMSHEIRTPMNAILGISEIMMREKLEARHKQYVKDINSSVKSLLTIINDILDVSKLQTGKFVLVPVHYRLNELIDNVMSVAFFLVEDRSIDLKVEIQEGVPLCLFGDDVRLRQVLLNLLSNAIKFTERGFVRLIVKHSDESLNITVSDSGIGIPPDKIQVLFEAFEQVDLEKNRGKTGTGLGLTITKTIVELMGGKISVESVYGEGSSFHVDIPLVLGDEALVSSNVKKDMGVYAPDAIILIVDDKQINLDVAAGLLRLMGMEPDLALSGRLAVERARQRQYDIIFMDYMMPDMNGLEATRALRDSGVTAPIIALTANVLEDAKEMMLDAGLDDFLSKPIIHSELTQILTKWLPSGKLLEPPGDRAGDEAELTDDKTDFWRRVDQIKGLCVSKGLDRIGGERVGYERMLRLLAHENNKGIDNMRAFLAAGDMDNFRIEVHGIKGALENIGASELSRLAYELEMASQSRDIQFCENNVPALIARLTEMNRELEEAFSLIAGEDEIPEIPPGLPLIFERMIKAFNDMDLASIDEEMGNIKGLEMSPALAGEIERIKEAIMLMDYDGAEKAIGALLTR